MTHPAAPSVVVVMGVSGSGKTTIGRLLAARAGMAFVDADDLHPPANKAKMAAGEPLTDDDREPWLRLVGQTMKESASAGVPIVVACSALRVRYREVLRAAVPDVVFVHLAGEPGSIATRLSTRTHEYMPATLLASQYATLEPLTAEERGLQLPATGDPGSIVEHIVGVLELGPASR